MSRYFKLLVKLCAVFVFSCNSAFAAGTLANTAISNTATLAYDVSGVAQPTITSPAATFLVDNKVNLDVSTSNTPTIVTPSQLQAVTTFTVTNLGNAVQDYTLTSGNVVGAPTVFGTADTFDALACNTFVETNGIAGYQAGIDIATFIDELAPDASKDVYVVCNIPAAILTSQQAVTELTAVTRVGGAAGLGVVLTESVGVDNPAAVDVVFADSATLANGLGTIPAQIPRDATAFARNAYRAAAVAVTVNKNATCSPAPADCSAAKTGTIITYTILVSITGSGSADNLVITDPLPVELINPAGLSVTPSLVGLQTATITGAGPYAVTVDLRNVAVTPATPKTYTITLNATIN
jgi:uncharacterized repeat protein (TIGR01451 family)